MCEELDIFGWGALVYGDYWWSSLRWCILSFCPLACAFNNETRDGSTNSASTSAIHQCEQRCNDDFMSLKSVDVSSTFYTTIAERFILVLMKLKRKSSNDGKN
jgi:hypothetical protein